MLARSILFNIAAYVTFLVEAVLFSPVLILPERWGWPIVKIWAGSTLWLHRIICGVGEDIRGLENMPPGPLLVASKHQSAWETLRLVTLLERPTFILKRQLLWVPLFGWYLWKFGQIPVDRGRRSQALAAMTERAKRAVAERRQIIIFPEGTRRPPLASPSYRYGVVHLYRQLAIPCLPVALNSGLFWPRRSIVHHPGTIAVRIGEPIAPGHDGETFARELSGFLETASSALIAEAIARDPGLRSVAEAEQAELRAETSTS